MKSNQRLVSFVEYCNECYTLDIFFIFLYYMHYLHFSCFKFAALNKRKNADVCGAYLLLFYQTISMILFFK